MSLHVGALFLILFLSIVGKSDILDSGLEDYTDCYQACSFPIAAKKIPRIPVPHRALFLSRHFGTGVLLATAFVHLLPTAYISLTDPCLPPFWNEGYPAMAGFIAMVSVFVVVGVEMFFATKGAGHSHSSEYAQVEQRDESGGSSQAKQNGSTRPPTTRLQSARRFKQDQIGYEDDDNIPLTRPDEENPWNGDANGNGTAVTARRRKSGEVEDDASDLDLDELDPQADDLNAGPGRRSAQQETDGIHPTAPVSAAALDEHQQQQKALLQCLLLEAGILFHSIFIGMAVSVATGTAFVVLLIAISFHQTFEGLALGSRIAGITAFPRHSPKPWLMALAYGTTTPIGQAIGLIVHNLYDPESQMGLLMVGIMNAISSGLLLFAGLVELLAEDFLSDQSYQTLHGRRRLEASAAVVAGSMLMALVGAWA